MHQLRNTKCTMTFIQISRFECNIKAARSPNDSNLYCSILYQMLCWKFLVKVWTRDDKACYCSFQSELSNQSIQWNRIQRKCPPEVSLVFELNWYNFTHTFQNFLNVASTRCTIIYRFKGRASNVMKEIQFIVCLNCLKIMTWGSGPIKNTLLRDLNSHSNSNV